MSLDHLPPRPNFPVTQSSLSPGPKAAFEELGSFEFSETLEGRAGRGACSLGTFVCSPHIFMDEAKVQTPHQLTLYR